MSSIARTADVLIYCGDDLSVAYENSEIPDESNLRRVNTPRNELSAVLQNLRDARWRDTLPRSFSIRAREYDTGQSMSIGFFGTRRIVESFGAGILGHMDFNVHVGRIDDPGDHDILVSDSVFRRWRRLSDRRPIRVPPWISQWRPIAGNWQDTLASLSPKLRSELRRWIRRHSFTVRISQGDDAIRRYFHDFHTPHLKKRFGDTAVLSREVSFGRRHRNAFRVDLLHGSTPVAANLLERQADRLAIRCCAMRQDIEPLTGRADVLDYFNLLIGQLLGCTVLDFGLSRPHLNNGAFRYKVKWGAVPRALPLPFKNDVRIYPMRYSPPTICFLKRNHFLQRRGGDLIVRMLHDSEPLSSDQDLPKSILKTLDSVGIEYVVDAALTEPLPNVPRGISFNQPRGFDDPYRVSNTQR